MLSGYLKKIRLLFLAFFRNSKMAGDEVGTGGVGGSAEGNEGAVDTTGEVNQGPGVPNDKTNEQD